MHAETGTNIDLAAMPLGVPAWRWVDETLEA
jgi:hypothetical protein